MTAAVIILSFICICLLWMLIKEKINIREIIRELKTRSAGDSNMPLPLAFPDKDIEKMLSVLNQYIDQYRNKLSHYVNHEADFRQQISNISHDLRTPLTAIIGYVQLIQKDADAEMNQAYLNIIANKAQILKSLIDQFYDLSRMEGNEYDWHMERLEIKMLIAQAMADYYNEFEEAGFFVNVEMPEENVYIMADSKGMMRIFHNLLQNVIKHGKNQLNVCLTNKAGKAVVIFENDSPTLDENEVAHLFDRFYTADRMRTGQNTGLGLAIVKAAAEHMGQSIRAVYEDGKLKIVLEMAVNK